MLGFCRFFFFFNDTATTEIYTLSLHDALPILRAMRRRGSRPRTRGRVDRAERLSRDRKSTRLNSSHGYISYAVFCLKKKNKPMFSLVVHTHKKTPTSDHLNNAAAYLQASNHQ